MFSKYFRLYPAELQTILFSPRSVTLIYLYINIPIISRCCCKKKQYQLCCYWKSKVPNIIFDTNLNWTQVIMFQRIRMEHHIAKTASEKYSFAHRCDFMRSIRTKKKNQLWTLFSSAKQYLATRAHSHLQHRTMSPEARAMVSPHFAIYFDQLTTAPDTIRQGGPAPAMSPRQHTRQRSLRINLAGVLRENRNGRIAANVLVDHVLRPLVRILASGHLGRRGSYTIAGHVQAYRIVYYCGDDNRAGMALAEGWKVGGVRSNNSSVLLHLGCLMGRCIRMKRN